MSKLLAELMRGVSPVWAAETEGAGSGAEAESEKAAEPVAEAEAEPSKEPVAETEAAKEPVAEAVKTPATSAKPDWKEQRIAKLTAKNKEMAEQLAAKAPTAAPTPSPSTGGAEFDKQVRTEAEKIASQNAFNAACNAVAAKGKESFGDFMPRVDALLQVVDKNDPASVAAYNGFLSAAMEVGGENAHKIIYAVGGDLNEAARLMALPPIKLALELNKLAEKGVGEESKLAKPITPIAGKAATHSGIDPTDAERADQLSTSEWMKRREAQVAQQARR